MASKSKLDEKVHVAVRCRPMTASERTSNIRRVVDCNSKSREISVTTHSNGMGLSSANTSKSYHFDKVFGPKAEQIDVYKSVVSAQLDDVLAGYNCTVLAYGQTGTGKTYTMEGERSPSEDYTWDNDPRAGIIPRALSQLFDELDKSGAEYSVRVSLLEIYNEEIHDLLSPLAEPIKMKIYEDNQKKGQGKVVVSGLTEIVIRNKSDIYDILQKGAIKRKTAATDLNEFSSRSHSIFTATIHTKDITQNNMEEEELVKIGKLNLVDLAGSENIGRSGAVEKRAREAGNINTSLLALGRCITALVEKAPHVPYRESKLTRLLQDSLGGNTKTSIIATISPGSDNVEETLSTLDYACRAKNINNKPRVNQKLTKRALIKEYDDEIERLRREVYHLREKNGMYLDPKEYEEMVDQLKLLTVVVQQRTDELEELKSLFKASSLELDEKKGQLSVLTNALDVMETKLNEESYVKAAYKEHGGKVLTQASQILATAENVTNEIQKVHNKVERAQSVNRDNQQSTSAFAVSIQENIDCFISSTMQVYETNMSSMDQIHTGLGKVLEQKHESVSEIKRKISSLQEHVATACQDNQEFQLELSAKLDEEADNTKEKTSDLMELVQTQAERSQSMLDEAKLISDNVLELLAITEQSYNLHTKLTEQMVNVFATSKSNVESNLKTLSSLTDQLVKEQEDQLAEMQEMMMQSISNMLTTMSSKHSTVKGNIDTLRGNHHEDMKGGYNVADQWKDATSKAKAQTISVVDEYSTKSSAWLQSMDSNVQETSAQLNEHIDELTRSHKALQSKWSTGLEQSSQNLEVVEEKSSELAESCHDALCTHSNNLTAGISDIMQSVGDVSSTVDDRKQELGSTSEAFRTTICDFQNSIQPIVPTGETPARKRYSYPRNLPPQPVEEVVRLTFLTEKEGDSEEQNEDEEEEISVVDAEEENDDPLSENIELQMNESITIPDEGGIPFFKKRRGAAKTTGTRSKSATRIPLRATNNNCHD